MRYPQPKWEEIRISRGSSAIKEGVEVESTSKQNDLGSDDEVRCFCNNKGRKVEMVQCEVCVGWFHLECLRMKEGVGVLDGKAFICCFCLSAKVLELTRLVGELWDEMTEMRESVEVLRKENDELVERVMVAESDWRRVECGGRLVKTKKKPVSVTHLEGRKSESGGGADMLRGHEGRSGDLSSVPVKKNRHGEYVGVRKLWGTRKKALVGDVKECLGEKFDEAKKVKVVIVIKEDNCRTRGGFG